MDKPLIVSDLILDEKEVFRRLKAMLLTTSGAIDLAVVKFIALASIIRKRKRRYDSK